MKAARQKVLMAQDGDNYYHVTRDDRRVEIPVSEVVHMAEAANPGMAGKDLAFEIAKTAIRELRHKANQA